MSGIDLSPNREFATSLGDLLAISWELEKREKVEAWPLSRPMDSPGTSRSLPLQLLKKHQTWIRPRQSSRL